MAPEQARGKAVDKRADIWAFGAVLFEMLTGRRPFDGEDMTEVLGAVVRLEPPWDTLPSGVPPPIRTLLQSCLTKDPRQRVADISTAQFVLDNAASLAAPAAPTSVAPAASWARRGRLVWVAACAVAAVLAAALAIPTLQHLRESPPPETRVEIVTPSSDSPVSFALSPDGRQIVFVASGDGASRLWVRSLAKTTAQPLAGTEGAAAPFWSPDGRSIGFFAAGALKRLDLGGSAPQTLATVFFSGGGTWSPDGVIVFAPSLDGAADARVRLRRRDHSRDDARSPAGRSPLSAVPARRPPVHLLRQRRVAGDLPGQRRRARSDPADTRHTERRVFIRRPRARRSVPRRRLAAVGAGPGSCGSAAGRGEGIARGRTRNAGGRGRRIRAITAPSRLRRWGRWPIERIRRPSSN